MTCTGYERIRFLGASVTGFSSSVGWNEQASTVTVSLVEDKTCSDGEGDTFTRPSPGTVVSFVAGDFQFDGIVQNWEYKEGSSGRVYEVILNDPREILEGVQLILDGYNGTPGNVYNLMNVYGFQESADYSVGFGGAFTNEAGMPWNRIMPAIQSINTGETPFGTKITFKGTEYRIDFSELPIVPDYYRISGGNASLLSCIGQVCADSGHDYMVRFLKETEEDPNHNTIYFKVVSRKEQPTLNYIQDFVTAKQGVSLKSLGRELRNENSAFFVVGGNKEKLYTTDYNDPFATPQTNSNFASIWPFWGVDRNGNAIIGNGYNDLHTFTAPCDIPGLPALNGNFTMTVGMLRAALASQTAWEGWMSYFQPDVCAQIGLRAGLTDMAATQIFSLLQDGRLRMRDLRDSSREFLRRASYKNDPQVLNALYQYVLTYANDFYGKKFMVLVPFVAAKFQSETGVIITSSESCDAAYHTPDGQGVGSVFEEINNTSSALSANYNPLAAATISIPPMSPGLYALQGGLSGSSTLPLGLPWQYEDLFTTEDNRFNPFVKFKNSQNYHLEKIDPESAIVYDQQLYMHVDQDPYFVYLNRGAFYSPRVVITLPNAVYVKNSNYEVPPNFGLLSLLLDEVNQINGNTVNIPEKIQKLILNSVTTMPYMSFAQAAQLPKNVAVCLRSNVLTYGPWLNAGVPGKVQYEKDDSLVPWNYGGYTAMDYTACAKIAEAVTNQQESETGAVEVPGLPEISLGDELTAGGPNVTDISASIDEGGIKTTYRFKTYVPLFGRFSKQNADRMRRLALQANAFKRSSLALLRQSRLLSAGKGRGNNNTTNKGADTLITNASAGPAFIKNETAPDMLISSYVKDDANDNRVSDASIGTMDSFVQMIDVDNAKNVAVMSIEGLIRGYSTDKDMTGMPRFEEPLKPEFLHTCEDLFPFIGKATSNLGNTGVATEDRTDISSVTFGNDWPEEGLQTFLESHEPEKAKGIGLAGPVIVAGWGYDLFGKPVPNSANDGDGEAFPRLGNNTFLNGFRKRSDKWKAGPVDLRWDDMRKVWTAPYMIPGLYNGNGTMQIWGDVDADSDTGLTSSVRSFFDLSTVESGTKVLAYPIGSGLIIFAADC